jgi:hypothetical protein
MEIGIVCILYIRTSRRHFELKTAPSHRSIHFQPEFAVPNQRPTGAAVSIEIASNSAFQLPNRTYVRMSAEQHRQKSGAGMAGGENVAEAEFGLRID